MEGKEKPAITGQAKEGGEEIRLKDLYQLNLEISRSLMPARVVGAALDGIIRILSPDTAMIYLRQANHLLLLDSRNIEEELPPLLPEKKDIGVCLCGLAGEGEPVFSRDIHKDPRCCLSECKDAGVRSFAALPLKSGEEIIGVMGLASHSPRDFEAEADFLNAIVTLVSVGLKNALLHEQVTTQARELEERIKSQEEAEEALAEEKNKLEVVLTSIQDGITVQDRDFRIIYQNRVHREKIGDHQGEYCYQAYYDRDEVCDDCPMTRSLTDGRIHQQEVTRNHNGHKVFLEVTSSPIRDISGEIVAGVEVIRDVTEQRQLAAQLNQAQKMESIGRLAGGIAHDFNNILTTIMGYSELAMLRLSPEAQDTIDDLEQIRSAGEKAAILTRQLLTFSRKQELSTTAVDINRLMANLAKMLQRMIGEDVVLKFNPGEGTGSIIADPGQLEQVLMNLAVNARDAMPEGGRLDIETRLVEIEADREIGQGELAPGRYVLLAVSDNGCGMDAEVQEKVFEPFFTTKETGRGTGLGLATVFGIVKQHKGAIHLYSEPDQGTTFRIYLPAGGAKAESRHEGASETAGPMVGGSETILVVDDEPVIRSLVVDTLAPLSYQTFGAASGFEALELLAKSRVGIDLLISDIIMPGMHGAELARRIRENYPGIKVIFMTGYLDSSVRQGMDPNATVLMKPLSPSVLAAKVREVLDRG